MLLICAMLFRNGILKKSFTQLSWTSVTQSHYSNDGRLYSTRQNVRLVFRLVYLVPLTMWSCCLREGSHRSRPSNNLKEGYTVFRMFTTLLSTLAHGDCLTLLLTPHCRLRPWRTKSLYLSCYSSLQLALPELQDRQANGLTDLAIFILRHTTDPVRHSPAVFEIEVFLPAREHAEVRITSAPLRERNIAMSVSVCSSVYSHTYLRNHTSELHRMWPVAVTARLSSGGAAMFCTSGFKWRDVFLPWATAAWRYRSTSVHCCECDITLLRGKLTGTVLSTPMKDGGCQD